MIGGCGGWCHAFHGLHSCLPLLEDRFKRVIIMPSSFDTAVESVRCALSQSRALVFARENVSYEKIKSLCAAELAHDCAFYFDFTPYRQTEGQGTLVAFRTDRESAFTTVPAANTDISVTCGNLDDWLQTIARHDLIRTDRAHVAIAGALLGKRVEYLPSNYHKLPAIIEFALSEFPITRLHEDWVLVQSQEEGVLPLSAHQNTGKQTYITRLNQDENKKKTMGKSLT